MFAFWVCVVHHNQLRLLALQSKMIAVVLNPGAFNGQLDNWMTPYKKTCNETCKKVVGSSTMEVALVCSSGLLGKHVGFAFNIM
jgi:hypothetical protein